MFLDELFNQAPKIEIKELSCDSRLPMQDAIFFCTKGIKYDGHDYVKEAINNGARVIIYEDDIDTNQNAIFIKVNNVDDVICKVSSFFYGNPADDIETYIVAGSYGRSSVANFINQLINHYKNCAYIGILGIKFNDVSIQLKYPTMALLDNQKYLKTLKNNDVKACTFEATSQALGLNKLNGINPNVFIFNNLSKESSDYRSTGREYYNNLFKYIYTLENNTTLVLNYDDESYSEIKRCVELPTISFGFNENADVCIFDVLIEKNSMNFKLKYQDKIQTINTNLCGLVNIYNIAAAITALLSQGYDFNELCAHANSLTFIPGIMESIDREYGIIVDCATEIDSIKNILEYGRTITNNQRLITILPINYNDDDDRLKNISDLLNKYCDLIILTEDKSYESNILKSLNKASKLLNKRSILIENRRSAIEEGIELIDKDDTLLIIGKGSENFLLKSLGKVEYAGDVFYAKKYLRQRKEEENEII